MRAPGSIIATLTAMALLAGCGGEEPEIGAGGEVPTGYATYESTAATFAYPSQWQVERAPGGPEGGEQLTIAPPPPFPIPGPQISLLEQPRTAPEEFERMIEQLRLVYETESGEVVAEEAIELAGAQTAVRTVVEFPAGPGDDPVEVRTTSVGVLRDDDTAIFFSLAVPQREGGGGVDVDAVLSSFSVTDS
jgi:hypothetical protein